MIIKKMDFENVMHVMLGFFIGELLTGVNLYREMGCLGWACHPWSWKSTFLHSLSPATIFHISS